MAELSPAALPTLAMLVAAAIFLAGSLANRLHRHRDAAVKRAQELSDRFEEKRSASQANADLWLREQQRALAKRPLDLVAILTLCMTLTVVVGIAVLAAAFGSDAQVPFPPEESRGRALGGFVLVALLVLALSLADVLRVRAELRAALAEAPLGQVALANHALRRARRSWRSSRKHANDVEEAMRLARQSVATSGSLVALPVATLGCSYLARLDGLDPPADALLSAEQHLGRAIEIGPASPSMWAAWAATAEESGNDEQAARRWLHAAELLARDELKLATLTSLDDQRDVQAAAFSKKVYRWHFRPRRAEVYGLALKGVDPTEPRALLTACILAMVAKEGSDAAGEANDALRRTLDRAVEAGAPAAARSIALALCEVGRAATPEVRQLGREYVEKSSQEILRPAEELVAAFGELDRQQKARSHEMQAILDLSQQQLNDFSKKRREADERWDRIERGEATEEDRAWQQDLLDEALHHVDQFGPEWVKAEAERQKREAGARKKRAREAAAEWEAVKRELDSHQRRYERIQTGRATKEDLDWLRSRSGPAA